MLKRLRSMVIGLMIMTVVIPVNSFLSYAVNVVEPVKIVNVSFPQDKKTFSGGEDFVFSVTVNNDGAGLYEVFFRPCLCYRIGSDGDLSLDTSYFGIYTAGGSFTGYTLGVFETLNKKIQVYENKSGNNVTYTFSIPLQDDPVTKRVKFGTMYLEGTGLEYDVNKTYYFSSECAKGNHTISSATVDTVDKEATCTTAGQKSKKCIICEKPVQETIKAIPAKGHVSGGAVVTKAAECEQEGEKTYSCSVCGTVLKKEIIPKTGHLFGNWYTIKDATALKEGLQERICDKCGKTETSKTAKLKAKVKLKKNKVTIKKGKKYTLKIKTKTYGDKILKWKSSKKKVAVVNKKGVVTAKKKGKTTITLYMKSGAVAKCKITVK